MSFTSNLNFNQPNPNQNTHNSNQANHARDHRNNQPLQKDWAAPPNQRQQTPQTNSLAPGKNIPPPSSSPQNAGNCPEGWRPNGPSCFFFGDHQNYDDAEYHCSAANGKLATITNTNSKFLIGYIRKESSGNDHWIKDSRLSGNSRAPAVANGKCPLIKGSSAGLV